LLHSPRCRGRQICRLPVSRVIALLLGGDAGDRGNDLLSKLRGTSAAASAAGFRATGTPHGIGWTVIRRCRAERRRLTSRLEAASTAWRITANTIDHVPPCPGRRRPVMLHPSPHSSSASSAAPASATALAVSGMAELSNLCLRLDGQKRARI